MMLLVVATTIVLPVVALAVIMPSESQSGENQAGCDQSAYIPKVLMGIHWKCATEFHRESLIKFSDLFGSP
jgi:hypothetical protein